MAFYIDSIQDVSHARLSIKVTDANGRYPHNTSNLNHPDGDNAAYSNGRAYATDLRR